ncbi:MAG: alpha/beta fold hydrolase [Alphaproteobacteria bacterium]
MGEARTDTYKSHDGLTLFYRDYGDPASPATPVICVPGLTRNSRDFTDLAAHLSSDRRVICPDLRGRGFSDYDPDYKNYHPAAYAQDMFTLLDTLGIDRVIWIGTSLGGLIGFVVAAMKPEVLAGVVLNDVGPVVAEEGLERIRAYTGKLPPVTSWEDAIQQAKLVYGASLPDIAEDRWPVMVRNSYREGEDGVPRLDMDPKIGDAVRETATPQGDPWGLWDRMADIPTLAIRGKLSDILDEPTFEEMAKRKPDLIRITVPNRGHVPLLDEPEALQAIDEFVAKIG